jgi:hypothetical protein
MAGLGREERPAAGTAELAAAEEDKEAAARIAARCSMRAVRTTTAATETLGLCLVADSSIFVCGNTQPKDDARMKKNTRYKKYVNV